MIIILCLHLVALWIVFSKFKLVRWGLLSGPSRCSLRCARYLTGSAVTCFGWECRQRHRFAGNAGVIGLLASILVWVSSYTAYL